MTKSIPSGYTKRDLIDYRARAPIRASQWGELANQQNHLFAHTGARFGGHTFEPPFATTSSTETATNENAGFDLDHLDEVGVLGRFAVSDQVEIRIRIFGSDITFAWDLTRISDGNTLVSGEAIQITSSTSSWAAGTRAFSKSDVTDGSGNLEPLRIDFRANIDADGATAKLYHFDVNESVLDGANELPTNR